MQSSAPYAAVVEPIQPVPSTSAIPFTDPSPALNPPPTSKSISATTTTRAAKGKLSSSTNGADGTPAVGKSAPSRPRRPPTKLFRCSGYGECSMTFSRSEHLARHVRKHTGERPFKCHCGREFSRLDNVRQHASTVHGDMVDRNQDTLNSLAALHNELSVTTVQTQRDNGMILQNPTDRPRRRSYAADKDDAAPTKPRKERASLSRRKAKGAAAASPAKAADDPPDAFPSDSNGNALQPSYTSLEGALESAEPYNYNAGSARSEYTTGAGQAALDPAAHKANFPPAPIHHQEIYGAMAPPNGTSVYPAMEFYAGASPTATYPTPPTQRVPALPSPQLAAQALTSQAHTPHPLAESAHVQYPGAEGHDHYAVPNASAAAFAAAPPPAEYPSELDALGGGKVSLPSISALLPASFAEGEGRLPGTPSEPVYGRAYGADSAPSFAPAPQHYPPPTSIPLQQAPSPSSWYGGPPTRPPSHLSIARHSPANVASYSEYPAVGSAIASNAASGEAALVQMAPQYSDQQVSGIQPRYDHSVQADSTQPHWYGHPAHVPQHDMYGRTSSLASSKRNGPPSLSHGSSHTSSTFTNHSPHYPHTLLPQPVFGHQFHPAGPNPGQPHPSYPYPPALNHMYPTAPHQIQHTPSQHNQFPEHYSSYAPPDPLMPPPPPHHLPSAQLQPHTSHFSSTSQRYPDHDARLFADAENKYNMAAGPQYAHLYPPSADSAFAGSNGALTNSYSHPRPGIWAPQPQAQR